MKNWELKSISDLVFLREEEPDSQLVAIGEIPIISKIRFVDGKIELRENGKSNTKLISVYPNDIIISGINVQKGAVAINNFDKIIAATIHYSAYSINEEATTLDFLYSYLRSHFFQELLKEKLSLGIKTEIKPARFLSLSIPYPDIDEQKMIQEELAVVEESRYNIYKLNQQQKLEIKNLFYSLNTNFERDYTQVPLSEILYKSENYEEVLPKKSFRQFGVKWWGEGVYERDAVIGHLTAYKYFICLEENDFVYNKIWGRHGAFGIVHKDVVGSYGGNEFPTYKYDQEILTPQWFEFIIKQRSFWQKCANKSYGTSGKNRIRPDELLKVTIPLPSKEEQQKLMKVIETINFIQLIKNKMETELSQLLPSVIDKAFKGEL